MSKPLGNTKVTYTPGFVARVDADITMYQLLQACEHATEKFNEEFVSDKYLFHPEARIEGGMLMVDWPGKAASMYKTIRIQVDESNCYPYLHDEMGTNVSDETVVWRRGGARKMSTFLKANRGAPTWTLRELRILSVAMQACMPIVVRTTSFPLARDLVSDSLTIVPVTTWL